MDIWIRNAKRKRVESDEDSNTRTNGKLKEGSVSSNDNHIYFYTDVTKKTIFNLITEINNVTNCMKEIGYRYSIDPPPIYLHINSYGGSIFAAMAAVDVILSNDVDIYTIVKDVQLV